MVKVNALYFALFAILISSMALPFHAFGQNDISVIPNVGKPASVEFVPGQVLVGLKNSDPNFDGEIRAHGGQPVKTIHQINAHVVKVPPNTEGAFISAISKNPNVEYAERDAIVTAFHTPSDSLFLPWQWGMQRIGAELAWDVETGLGSGVKVAVVDTGVYYNHVDLFGRVDTVNDKDFVDDDDDVLPTKKCQGTPEWHGTFVSGIIAGIENGVGIVGVAQVEILPVRVLNECGSGSSFDVADGIIHAADNGADVINLSLGSTFPSSAIQNSVAYAHSKNIVIVAAAGNSGTGQTLYPAGFLEVISTSATAKNDNLASYSSFGDTIEISAPGGDGSPCSEWIVSSFPGNDWRCSTGTSFAAPHVSGVAALLKAQYKADSTVTNEDIRNHLHITAEDLGPAGFDNSFGYGLVRADLAVKTSIDSETPPPVTNNPPEFTSTPVTAVTEDSLYTYDVTAVDVDTGEQTTLLITSALELPGWLTLTDNDAGAAVLTGTPSENDDGTTTVTLTVTDNGTPNLTDSQTFDIVILEVNTAPVLSNPGTQTFPELSPVLIPASASDSDLVLGLPNTLTFGASGLPAWATINPATGTITGTPTENDDFTTTVTLTVTDDGTPNLTASVIFDIIITEVNTAPPVGDTNKMYVWEISFAEKHKGKGGSMTDLKIRIDINQDSDGDATAEAKDKPAKNAFVKMVLTYDTDGDGLFEPATDDDSWTFGTNTNKKGQVNFTLKLALDGNYQANVTSLTHSSLTWNSFIDVNNPATYVIPS